MKQNAIVAGLAAENRRLREHIQKMSEETNQGKWMEDLVAHALTGLLARSGNDVLEPEAAAKRAIECAEAVLARIVASIRHADATAPAPEPAEEAKEESKLILNP